MKFRLLAVAAAMSLALGAAAEVGGLAPSLQQAMAGVETNTDLPVIVQFTEGVDRAALRAEAKRIAKTMYPHDAKKRRRARRKLIRKMLVRALKDQARDSKKQVKAFLKAHQEHRKLTLLWARNSVAGELPASLLEELAGQPGIETIKLDARIQGPGPGTPPSAPTFCNLDTTGARSIWDRGYTGSDAVVATIDTGVDASHPDLGPRWRGGGNSWFDPAGQYASPADTNGHGTQVMGLIVGGAALGYQIGMAPDARWIAAKVFDSSNQATLSGIHQAYQWVLDPDDNPATDDVPDIVSNSWDLAATVNQCNQEFADDLALLSAADIAVVFAGGNYGPGPDTSVSPANDPSVVAVGTVDSGLNIDIQSSRGAGACDGGIFPHLVAPGEGVLTADRVPIYDNFVSGTSFAVAHVAGAMALLKSAFPEAGASQLRAALIESALDLGDAGPDHTYGYGMIDLPAAYARLAADLGGSPGSLQLSATGYSVDENVASLTLTVTRTEGTSGDVSIDYSTADGTATAGQDYLPASGTLELADGEASGSFTVTILDDGAVEGDETFSVTLSHPLGASLGTPASAEVVILDEDVLDSDGFAAVLDCDDSDPSVHPGASEVKHDGVDKDCNGYDLTIEITRARYVQSQDRLILWATSDLGSAASLREVTGMEGGGTLTRTMNWKSNKSRWQRTINGFVAKFGALPVAVTVSGREGAEAALIEQR